MKIIVCIKIVPDPSVLEFDLETRSFDPHDFVYMVNPLDLVALEAALVAKEKTGAEVICISMAPPSMIKRLRQCLARGGDRAILLAHDSFADSDYFATATVLAAAIKKIGFDLILCGDFSEGGHGGTGPTLAALLDVPHSCAITQLEVSKDIAPLKKIAPSKVNRALEKGEREVLECSLPALFTVHHTLNVPGYPDFPSSLAALEKEIPVWGLEELGLDRDQVGKQGSLTNVVDFSLPRPRPKVPMRIDAGLTPAQRMAMLISGGVNDRKTQILEGDPADMANKIVNIIETRKPKSENR